MCNSGPKTWMAVLILLLCFPLFSLWAADDDSQEIFQKAIFVDAVGPELSAHTYAEECVNKVRETGFDTIILQARSLGEIFYSSVLEPRSTRINSGYPDPLLDYILMCHATGLETRPIKVMAWINPFQAHDGQIKILPPVGNIIQRHPGWIMENNLGEKTDQKRVYYVDPGNPAVQNYITGMIVELVRKYNIDALLLDEFRYPVDGLNWGYSPQALAAYFADTGLSEKPLPHDPRFCDWRRRQLTLLLQKIRKSVHEIKPDLDIYVGAVACGEAPKSAKDFKNTHAYSLVFQNWLDWMEKNLVDGLVLYNYKQDPQQEGEFSDWIDFVSQATDKDRIICAIGGFFNFNDAVLKQMRNVREKGLAGLALYCYRAPSQDNPDLLLASLSSTVFSENLFGFRRSGITYERPKPIQPSPTPEPTTPTLSLVDTTTATVQMVEATPEPTPVPVVVPSLPGLPALPDLAALITPTPEVTEVPPTPTAREDESDFTGTGEPEKRIVPVATPGSRQPTATPTPFPVISGTKWDTIHLKNGSTMKGKILEEMEGKVTIKTSKGFLLTFPIEDVEKVVKYR